MICIHELNADTDRDARERPEQDVCHEEHFGLLLEKLFIIPESVRVFLGHLLQVNQIVLPVERQIKDLLCENEGSERDENERVEFFFAASRSEYAKEESYCKHVEEDAHAPVRHSGAIPIVVVGSRRAPVRHDAEGEEVTVAA